MPWQNSTGIQVSQVISQVIGSSLTISEGNEPTRDNMCTRGLEPLRLWIICDKDRRFPAFQMWSLSVTEQLITFDRIRMLMWSMFQFLIQGDWHPNSNITSECVPSWLLAIGHNDSRARKPVIILSSWSGCVHYRFVTCEHQMLSPSRLIVNVSMLHVQAVKSLKIVRSASIFAQFFGASSHRFRSVGVLVSRDSSVTQFIFCCIQELMVVKISETM